MSQQQQSEDFTHFQTQQQQQVLSNYPVVSGLTSPNASAVNLINSIDNHRPSIQNSPMNLSASLSNLSFSNASDSQRSQQQGQLPHQSSPTEQHQPTAQLYTVKLTNLPTDITLREAYCIFAFAKEFANLDIVPDSTNQPIIFARFRSLSAASAHSSMLEKNNVFGPGYPYLIQTEIIETTSNNFAISSNTSSSIHGPNTGSNQQPGFNLGKRPSIGNHRSRFLFSDPFSTDTIQENVESPATHSGVGKSMILLESHDEAREYEQLVRDPWQGQVSNPSSQPSSAQSQLPPSVNSLNGIGSIQPQALQTQTSASLQTPQFNSSTPQTPTVEWDRRRQGSAFFNNPSPLLAGQISTSNQMVSQLSLNGNGGNPPTSQPLPQPLPTSSKPSSQLPPNSAPQLTSAPSQPPQSQANTFVPPSTSATPQQPQPQAQAQQQQQLQQSSQVDLSLLARVPPPVNPADQNPPCNTLYVGNLPPDATEAELRQLFAPQKGFRRLSFRNKNQSISATSGSGMMNGQPQNNSHGPMCFVEFEDVAHATKALADLYGRTLPRPGGLPGKGGIRLSFSKNPLGVRGPGQRRTSNFMGYNQHQSVGPQARV